MSSRFMRPGFHRCRDHLKVARVSLCLTVCLRGARGAIWKKRSAQYLAPFPEISMYLNVSQCKPKCFSVDQYFS